MMYDTGDAQWLLMKSKQHLQKDGSSESLGIMLLTIFFYDSFHTDKLPSSKLKHPHITLHYIIIIFSPPNKSTFSALWPEGSVLLIFFSG